VRDKKDKTLTRAEEKDLQSLEKRLEDGIVSFFFNTGSALKEINEKRLYRKGYSTFKEYCFQKWEISPKTAYQLIAAAEIYEELKKVASDEGEFLPLPLNEAQVRPLVALPPAERLLVWREVSLSGSKVTSAQVAAIASKYKSSPPPLLEAEVIADPMPKLFTYRGEAQDELRPGTKVLAAQIKTNSSSSLICRIYGRVDSAVTIPLEFLEEVVLPLPGQWIEVENPLGGGGEKQQYRVCSVTVKGIQTQQGIDFYLNHEFSILPDAPDWAKPRITGLEEQGQIEEYGQLEVERRHTSLTDELHEAVWISLGLSEFEEFSEIPQQFPKRFCLCPLPGKFKLKAFIGALSEGFQEGVIILAQDFLVVPAFQNLLKVEKLQGLCFLHKQDVVALHFAGAKQFWKFESGFSTVGTVLAKPIVKSIDLLSFSNFPKERMAKEISKLSKTQIQRLIDVLEPYFA